MVWFQCSTDFTCALFSIVSSTKCATQSTALLTELLLLHHFVLSGLIFSTALVPSGFHLVMFIKLKQICIHIYPSFERGIVQIASIDTMNTIFLDPILFLLLLMINLFQGEI